MPKNSEIAYVEADIEKVLHEIDAWFHEEIQRPPVSYVTEIYNQMHAAVESLRNRLSVVITGQAIVSPSTDGGAAAPAVNTQEAPASDTSKA